MRQPYISVDAGGSGCHPNRTNQTVLLFADDAGLVETCKDTWHVKHFVRHLAITFFIIIQIPDNDIHSIAIQRIWLVAHAYQLPCKTVAAPGHKCIDNNGTQTLQYSTPQLIGHIRAQSGQISRMHGDTLQF